MIEHSHYELNNAYLTYYSNPNDDNKHHLAQTITEFGIPCQIDIIPKFTLTNDNTTLVSNGSTYNCGTRYQFGPHTAFWIHTIERRLRGSGIMVGIGCPNQFDSVLLPEKYHKYNRITNHPQFDFEYTCELRNSPKHVINILYNIFRESGPINLVAHPHIWLYMFSNRQYRELLSEAHWIKSIINTDSDMFFRTDGMPFKFNNQMINWKTGVNFYTCEYGSTHSLPTFNNDRAINLLNQNPSSYNDDKLIIHDIAWCKCGKQKLISTFIPHKNNQIVIDNVIYRPLQLVSELQSNYLNLQFHQINNFIDVYYSTSNRSMQHHDKEVIKYYFRKFKLRFYQSSLFYIGRKIPTFWKGNGLCVIEDKTHKIKPI